ncbi:hypothetical protein QYF61_014182 [Mycteria americana]|uniref:Uncharacterized protein n=1 Tax=Mycteria americana TaxID=33587 RepID=A0AAN7P7B1_MYCAM|nr:hypothetical protein QYF61_014182 [Mycteria americana]
MLGQGKSVRRKEQQRQSEEVSERLGGHLVSSQGQPTTPLIGDGDSTTSLGSLFQWLATLSVKNFFLISNLNLPWHNLRPFPFVLSLVTWEKRPTPTSLQPPFRVVTEAIWIKTVFLNEEKFNPCGYKFLEVTAKEETRTSENQGDSKKTPGIYKQGIEWQNLLLGLNKTPDKTIAGVYRQMTSAKTPGSERAKDKYYEKGILETVNHYQRDLMWVQKDGHPLVEDTKKYQD